MPHQRSSAFALFSRRMGVAFLAMAIALQPGCTRHVRAPAPPEPPPVTAFQSSLGAVAVVAAESTALAFPAPVPGGPDNAHATGSGAFRVCVDLAGRCWGDKCEGALIGLAVCGLVVAPIAAAIGTAQARHHEIAQPPKVAEVPKLDASIMQVALRDRVVAHAAGVGARLVAVAPERATQAAHENDYRPLAKNGVQTVLEVALTHLFEDTRSKSRDPSLTLSMQAHVRLVRTADNSEVFADDYFYYGHEYKYSEWAAHGAEKLLKDLKTGYDNIGQDVSERVFMLYPFAERHAQGKAEICGLAPISPGDEVIGGLQPQLVWESFPRAVDRAAAPDDMRKVGNVRYDLIVARGGNGETPEIVYQRDGLADAKHQVEAVLEPDTRYFWSVRARFTLDGRERVTEWATSCPFEPQLVVDSRIYRFYTPESR